MLIAALACWALVSIPAALLVAAAIPPSQDDPCDDLPGRSRAFRQIGFDIPHVEGSK